MKRIAFMLLLSILATSAIYAVEKSITIKFEKEGKFVDINTSAIPKDKFAETAVSSGAEYIDEVKVATNRCYYDNGCFRLGSSSANGVFSFTFQKIWIKVPTRVVVNAMPNTGTSNECRVNIRCENVEKVIYRGSLVAKEKNVALKNPVYKDFEFLIGDIDNSEVLEFSLESVKGLFVKSLTIYYDEKEVSSLADINTVGSYKVNAEIAGIAEKNGIMYARSLDVSETQPSPDTYTGSYKGEIGKTSYEDNDMSNFYQYDWIAIDNTTSQRVETGLNLMAGFTARFDGNNLIPIEGVRPGDATSSVEPIRYRAENLLHGQFSNYDENAYPAFFVLPRLNEVAEFIGYIETKGGVSYMYSDNANGRLNGYGVKLEGDVDVDVVEGKYTKFNGVVLKDTTLNCGYKILLLSKLGAEQITTGVETANVADIRLIVSQIDGIVKVKCEESVDCIEVYDAIGRIIKNVTVSDGEADLSLAAGYYIVKAGNMAKTIIVK